MKYFIAFFFCIVTIQGYSQITSIKDTSTKQLEETIDSLTTDLIFKLKINDSAAQKLIHSKLLLVNKDTLATITLFFTQEQIMSYFIMNDFKSILSDIKDTSGTLVLNKRRADTRKREAHRNLFKHNSRYYSMYQELLDYL